MSNIAQAIALVTVGGLMGFGGFALMTQHSAPAVASTAPAPLAAAAPVEPAVVRPEPAAQPPRAAMVDVEFATTGSVESDAPDAAFAVLRVTASVDVADVVLEVGGKSGAIPEEALGAESSARRGSALRIELGEMHAREEREVVIGFRLRGERGGFTTATSYLDVHTGEQRSVLGSPQGNDLQRMHREGATYEAVRLAYSDHALRVARELRDEGQYADALNWVEHAYATNVEVGMTLRITRELTGAQGELSRMRDELEVLMKPRKKPARKPAPIRVIEVVGGDT